MKTIGITGGVGAGKSEILDYISKHYNCRIIKADNLAYELESPGNICYQPIVDLCGEDILLESGFIDKNKMAKKIFSDSSLLEQVNGIIHPAVKKYICSAISEEKNNNKVDYLILEAALLLEEGYRLLLDEIWYIRVDADIRRKRLKESRGYSDEKIDAILAKQMSDEEFMSASDVVIDNSCDLEYSYEQIKKYLG